MLQSQNANTTIMGAAVRLMVGGVGTRALGLNGAAVSSAGRRHMWELETCCLARSGLAAPSGSGLIVLTKHSVG